MYAAANPNAFSTTEIYLCKYLMNEKFVAKKSEALLLVNFWVCRFCIYFLGCQVATTEVNKTQKRAPIHVKEG